MSIHWVFHAEVRCGEGWKLPPGLPPMDARLCPIGGEFGWMPEHWTSDKLFFGADALFPFARGRPPGNSEFCRLWDKHRPGWDSDNEKSAHWIDYDRLYVNLWGEPTVLVVSHTKVRLAGLFGDGTHSLPEAALWAAGATDDDFYVLRKWATLASGAIDRIHGVGRGEIEKLQPEQEVFVSWQTSIDWLLPSCAKCFHELRRLASTSNLRVITWRG